MTKELTPLEALERIRTAYPYCCHDEETQDLNIIETALKALEIISKLPTEIKQKLLNASYTHFKNDEYYDLLKEELL